MTWPVNERQLRQRLAHKPSDSYAWVRSMHQVLVIRQLLRAGRALVPRGLPTRRVGVYVAMAVVNRRRLRIIQAALRVRQVIDHSRG